MHDSLNQTPVDSRLGTADPTWEKSNKKEARAKAIDAAICVSTGSPVGDGLNLVTLAQVIYDYVEEGKLPPVKPPSSSGSSFAR